MKTTTRNTLVRFQPAAHVELVRIGRAYRLKQTSVASVLIAGWHLLTEAQQVQAIRVPEPVRIVGRGTRSLDEARKLLEAQREAVVGVAQ